VDVLQAFAAIRANQVEAWSFVTDLDRIGMWTAPWVELVVPEGGAERLDEGSAFGLVLNLPRRPAFNCVVLSLAQDAVTVKLDGFVRGVATWRVVPAGEGVIVHVRLKLDLADRRWLVPWVLVGRWLAACGLNWLVRRYKARVEDTVGSSEFGIPLPVSPYAAVSAAVAAGLALGIGVHRIGRWLDKGTRRDRE
jgi:hypothetical protein